jgi:hypothetical protein
MLPCLSIELWQRSIMSTPSPSFEIVTLVNRSDMETLQTALRRWGFFVYQLDGAQVTDRRSFLNAVTQTLSLPAGFGIQSWHGFQDHLWGSLCGVEASHVAFIWQDADQMLSGGLGDLLTAVSIFEETGRRVYNFTESGFPHEMDFTLFLVGDGANFPPFPYALPDDD